MLIINFHFHICFTELKIYHLWFLSPHSAMLTLMILAVCRTRVKYEPSKWPRSQWVLRSSVDRAPTWWLGCHRFDSCRGFILFFAPRLWHADYFHFHKIKVLLINSETTIITPWLTSPCRVPKMRKSNVIWRVFKWVNERKTSPAVTEVPWCIPKLLIHNAY